MLPSGLTMIDGEISGTIANDASAFGPYSVTVLASDSSADVSASQTFSWIVSSAPPPIAAGDAFVISHDLTMDSRWSMRDSVLANDSDPAGHEFTAVLVSGPAHAVTFQLDSDGHFVLEPELHYVGHDSFSYQGFNGFGYSTIVTVGIDLANAAPTKISLSNAAIKVYDTQVGTFSALDPDYLETFTYALVNTAVYPDNGSFAIQDDQVVVATGVPLKPGSHKGASHRRAMRCRRCHRFCHY